MRAPTLCLEDDGEHVVVLHERACQSVYDLHTRSQLDLYHGAIAAQT